MKHISEVYRYDSNKDAVSHMQTYEAEFDGHERMLPDALIKLKELDESTTFCRSCREDVYGLDAVSINDRNGLACLTNMRELSGKTTLRSLSGPPVVHDLIVGMTQFFNQYHSIKSYLINGEPSSEKERLQSPEEREELDDLYECILCTSCSASYPLSWWSPDKSVSPASLLQVRRFIADSRDQTTSERLNNLEDPYRLFRCHTVVNYIDVYPKGLNPTKAINKIKELMVRRTM